MGFYDFSLFSIVPLGIACLAVEATTIGYYKLATLGTASYRRLGADASQSSMPAISGSPFAALASDQLRFADGTSAILTRSSSCAERG